MTLRDIKDLTFKDWLIILSLAPLCLLGSILLEVVAEWIAGA